MNLCDALSVFLTLRSPQNQRFVSDFGFFVRSDATPRNAKWPHGRSNLQLWCLDSSSALCMSDVKIRATCAYYPACFHTDNPLQQMWRCCAQKNTNVRKRVDGQLYHMVLC